MNTGGRGLDDASRNGGLADMMTGRVGAFGFMALSLVLALGLIVTLGAWKRERAGFQSRIAELSQANERSQITWKAQLAACHAATSPRRAVQTGAVAGDDAAGRLLAQGPEGIDVCARMESADQAVLATLK